MMLLVLVYFYRDAANVLLRGRFSRAMQFTVIIKRAEKRKVKEKWLLLLDYQHRKDWDKPTLCTIIFIPDKVFRKAL